MPPLVHNLSSHPLTKEELSVLERGLYFIPTGPFSSENGSPAHDFREFRRRALLRLHFGEVSTRPPKIDLIKSPSTWTPPPASRTIASYLHSLRRILDDTMEKPLPPPFPNLNHKERQALKDLRRSDLTIKPADKGGSTVVMDTPAYRQACLALLNSPAYGPPTLSQECIEQKTRSILVSMRDIGLIKEKTYEWCANQTGGPRPFFGLPKIHKDPSTWSFGIPPLRPIVSDCPSSTYQTSRVLDALLQPFSTLHPSYLKDTPHLVRVLRDTPPLPHNAFLFTADVVSLYTSIPHTDGIQATSTTLLRHGISAPRTQLICDLLDLQLHHNTFVFEDKEYQQNHGVAMGKSWAPAYANIYMAEWETRLWSTTPSHLLPIFWKRYIDDILGAFQGTPQQWAQFLSLANGLDPNIKITTLSDNKEVPFLDLAVYKEPSGLLGFRLHRKATDTLQYIRGDSMHPSHSHKGVAISQFLRALRNSSSVQDQISSCAITATAFRRRGYSARTLRLAYKRARSRLAATTPISLANPATASSAGSDSPTMTPPAFSLSTTTPSTTSSPSSAAKTPRRDVLVMTYHHRLKHLPKRLRQHHQHFLTHKCPSLRPAFPEPPMVAWRRTRNIRDILVSPWVPRTTFPAPPPVLPPP